ncbi:MAG TPA: HEAT repeat domain-containing protein [Gemmatimonadaceae bacterium]
MRLGTAGPATSTPERETHAGWSGRVDAVDHFLTLFAKAVRQLHAYPVTSPVCVDAVGAARAHLAAIDGPDEMQFAVTPDALLMHEHVVGDGPFVRHELTRRLRRARVTSLTIQRDCTVRDLTRFGVNLLRGSESADRTLSVADLMAEDGVDAIVVEVTARREVLPVSPSVPAQRDLIAHERRRREDVPAPNTRTVHLFPPHRGWIRLDPAEVYEGVNLADLAILVDNPDDLAAMLDRLVDDAEVERGPQDRALERRFSNVASLFAGLEPRLSRVLFGKLARVLLSMEPERRRSILTTSVLPAIFDGRPDAHVLHAFSDADLAEALSLLLDPQRPGMGVALSALDQLKLTPERRTAVVPLMEELMRARIDPALGLDAASAIALDQQARRLTSIQSHERRSLEELSGFDFRLDAGARAAIDDVRDGIRNTDGLLIEVICLVNLTGLQPNPEVAAAFVRGAMERAAQLVSAGRWSDLTCALERLAAIRAAVQERRPEIAALIDSELNCFCTPEFGAALLAQQREGNEMQAVSLRLIDALGPSIAPALLALLESDGPAATVAVTLMSERAALFAPGLVENLDSYGRLTRAHVARILGHAGPGYEDTLGGLCDRKDERTTREALRALSRIGTTRAAELVAVVTRDARDWMSTAAVETLLRFPPEIGGPAIRDVLAHRPFVLSQPADASRLIGRMSQARVSQLEPVLRAIAALKYRFWNRALVRCAREAGALLAR